MRICTLVLLIIQFFNLNGQNVKIEPDAIWVYNYTSMFKSGKEIMTNTNQDTIINDIHYTILDRKGLYFNDDITNYDTLSLKSYYVRSDSCCIYLYSFSKEKETKLYDFDLKENDLVDFIDLRYYNDYTMNVKSSKLFSNNGDSIIGQVMNIKLNNYPEGFNEFSVLVKENIGAQNVNFNLTELGDPWCDIPYYSLCHYKSENR